MKLDQWLQSQDITQTDFAARLGTTGASLSRIVAGAQWPSAPLMAAIERETGGEVTASDILASYQGRDSAPDSRDTDEAAA
jgi:transcriptional regulator with XRE-family HTH domain